MLATEREWLTGRPTRHDVDWAAKAVVVERAHVALVKRPVGHERVSAPLIFPDRVASPAVPLNDRPMLKAGERQAHA
jgi:hypothetical protein